MSNRIASCPQAKQIVGVKSWLGWAQGFAFPGFKANWVNTYAYYQPSPDDRHPGQNRLDGLDLFLRWRRPSTAPRPTSTSATSSCSNCPAAYGEDSFTSMTQTYPKCWLVYICTNAITGSATDPIMDAAHFAPWDWTRFDRDRRHLQHRHAFPPTAAPAAGPAASA